MPGTAEHLIRTLSSAAASGRRCAAVFLAMMLSATLARADDLPSQIAAANKLMQDGKPAEALAIYSAAADTAGANPPAELLFNLACAQLSAGQIAEAEKDLRTVLTSAPTSELRSAAAYNLGLLESQRADAQQEQAPKDAIDTLRRAERLFRTATSESADPAAAKNIDLLQRRIAALLDRQKKEDEKKDDKSGKDSKDQKSKDSKPNEKKDGQQGKPDDKNQQSNPSQPDDKNLSEDLNKLADQQEHQGKKSNDLSKQSEQGAPKEQQQEQQKQAADQQKDIRDKTEQAKKQAESKSSKAQDQPQKDAMSRAKDKLDKAEKAQQQAEEKLKQGDTKAAEQLQKEAAQQLRDAAQQAKSAEEAKKQQELKEQQEQAAQDQQQGDKDQSKPFDATAAQILDQERKEKAMRDRIARQRARPVPVSKDW